MQKLLKGVGFLTLLAYMLQAGGDMMPVAVPVASDRATTPDPSALAPSSLPESNSIAEPDSDQKEHSPYYVGLGGASASTHGKHLVWEHPTDGQDRYGTFVGIAGYKFNDYLAVEARGAVGSVLPDIVTNYELSVFAKPMYPVTKKTNVYGLLGAGWVKTDGIAGYPDLANDVSLQWGLGTGYYLNQNVELTADYTWLLQNQKAEHTLLDGSSDVNLQQFTIGALYHF